jgi:signal transduction histidine kinase
MVRELKGPTPHPSHVRLSIASPSEIERTARHLATIREGFLSTQLLTTCPARPIILDSWRRCRALHVDPMLRFAPYAIAHNAQLRERWEANAQLLQAARPVMHHLADLLADSGYVVVLTDAAGCILTLIGDQHVRRRLARIDFIPGGSWSEAAAGTNAIGTALADGHIVQLMASEHYCAGWGDLTCTAAPIHHPVTSRIIGVLDVTGDYRLIRSHLTSLLATAALEVEQGLRALLVDRQRSTGVATDRASLDGVAVDRSMRGHTGRAAGDAGARAGRPETASIATLAEGARSLLHAQALGTRDAVYLVAAGGTISASLDVQITVERVAEQTAHLLGLDSAATGLFDETGQRVALHVWFRRNVARPEATRAWEEILEPSHAVSLLRQRGEPVIIDDVRASALVPATLVERLDVRSLALLPLTGARGVIGFIVAPRPTAHHWAIDEVRLGLTLAAEGATAIENARLFDALQRHNRRIEALNAVARLLSTLLDPSQHLDAILERIIEILGLAGGMVLLCDEYAGHLTLAAHHGLPETLIHDLREHPLQLQDSHVVTTGESLLIGDARDDERVLYEPLRTANLHDWMAVPLAGGGAILGVLLVAACGARTLTDDDLGLFTAIGQQLGLALRNERLVRAASEMEALRKADRLKSEFVATVSHDLRTPLTAIRASVEGLLDHGDAHSIPQQEHLLHNIAGQAGRLGRLVDQLLDLSQIEAGGLRLDRDWIELPALIADAVAGVAGLDGTRRIEQKLPANAPLLFVDYDRLLEVFYNLLENACKYTPPGSPITIEVDRTAATVLIGVADRGPGIPAAEHEAVFHRFYRLDSDGRTPVRGSGLGLAICRGIVEAHGGRIWVEDRPGGGCVFRIALPLPVEHPVELEVSA